MAKRNDRRVEVQVAELWTPRHDKQLGVLALIAVVVSVLSKLLTGESHWFVLFCVVAAARYAIPALDVFERKPPIVEKPNNPVKKPRAKSPRSNSN